MPGQTPHYPTGTHSSIAAFAAATALLGTLLGCGAGSSVPASNAPTPIAVANGPQLGYVWNNADQTLRPILGVPGASQVGASVVTPGAYTAAATSAAASLAVAQAADGTIDVLTLPSGIATRLNITIAGGANLRLSPSGSAALVYSPGSTTASVVTGLPTTPQVSAVSAPAAIVDSAVSDSGSIAFEFAQGSTLGAEVVPTSGKSNFVASLQSDGGLSFLPGADNLLLADTAANALTLVTAASSAPALSVLPTSGTLQAPSALAVSRSGRWVLVVNGSGNTLARVDLRNQSSLLVACTCKPTLAAPLADDGAFRVTGLTSGPMWVVDAAAAAPRVLFIPALPAAAKGTGTGSTVQQ